MTLQTTNMYSGYLPITLALMGSNGYTTVSMSSYKRSVCQRFKFSSIHRLFFEQNTQVSETKEFRQPYLHLSDDRNDLLKMLAVIKCYRGLDIPRWADINSRMSSFNNIFSASKNHFVWQICIPPCALSKQTRLRWQRG